MCSSGDGNDVIDKLASQRAVRNAFRHVQLSSGTRDLKFDLSLPLSPSCESKGSCKTARIRRLFQALGAPR